MLSVSFTVMSIITTVRNIENYFKNNIKNIKDLFKQSAALNYETESIGTVDMIIATMFQNGPSNAFTYNKKTKILLICFHNEFNKFSSVPYGSYINQIKQFMNFKQNESILRKYQTQ